MNWKLLTTTLLTAVSSFSFAAEKMTLGQPEYGGTGCPMGSVSAVLAPGQEALSLLFDQYVVSAGQSAGKKLDRKSCNVVIPVTVPQGYSVGIFKVDYRGFASIPRGANGSLNIEYFFAGARGPIMRTPFVNTQQDYLVSHELQTEAVVWTPCGANTNLRINSSILAQSNRANEETILTVDSADITSGLQFHIKWRQCR